MAAQLTNKIAVVTGGNKGIGLEICRQLASQGITVVLTARDEKKGLEAVDKLKTSSLSGQIFFHQLDVADSATVAPLAEFIKSRFGKLDILVNNAGITGSIVDPDVVKTYTQAAGGVENYVSDLSSSNYPQAAGGVAGGAEINWAEIAQINWGEIMTQTYELAADCIQTNYCGARRTTEALLPLLQLSDSPRIVNVSSAMGKLKLIPGNEWAKGVLNDPENLTEERIDEVVNAFLKDFKEGSLEAKGWPQNFAAYIVSKAALSAYTRLLAKKYPSFRINCVCPGYVRTDINYHTGYLTAEEGAESPVKLALVADDGPTGLFFFRKEVSSFEG